METKKEPSTEQIKDQAADKSTNSIPNKRDCMISYLVIYKITRVVNGNPTVIVNKQKKFHEPYAIHARKKAFQYARELDELSKVDGKLCAEHINTEFEIALAQRKNYIGIKITIYFHDEYFINDRWQISGKQPYDGYNDYVDKLEKEFKLYKRYNYDTGGDPMTVSLGGYHNYEIINMSTTGVCDKLYHVSKLTSLKKLKDKQICSTRNNPIILLPTDRITDNMALEFFEQESTYVVSEVSVLGINSGLTFRNFDFCSYKDVWGYGLQQKTISPEFVSRIEIRNTAERNYFEDFDLKDKAIELERHKERARTDIRNSFRWHRNEWLNVEMGVELFIEDHKYLMRDNEDILRNIVQEEFDNWYNGLEPIEQKGFDIKRSTKRFDL